MMKWKGKYNIAIGVFLMPFFALAIIEGRIFLSIMDALVIILNLIYGQKLIKKQKEAQKDDA